MFFVYSSKGYNLNNSSLAERPATIRTVAKRAATIRTIDTAAIRTVWVATTRAVGAAKIRTVASWLCALIFSAINRGFHGLSSRSGILANKKHKEKKKKSRFMYFHGKYTHI